MDVSARLASLCKSVNSCVLWVQLSQVGGEKSLALPVEDPTCLVLAAAREGARADSKSGVGQRMTDQEFSPRISGVHVISVHEGAYWQA